MANLKPAPETFRATKRRWLIKCVSGVICMRLGALIRQRDGSEHFQYSVATPGASVDAVPAPWWSNRVQQVLIDETTEPGTWLVTVYTTDHREETRLHGAEAFRSYGFEAPQ